MLSITLGTTHPDMSNGKYKILYLEHFHCDQGARNCHPGHRSRPGGPGKLRRLSHLRSTPISYQHGAEHEEMRRGWRILVEGHVSRGQMSKWWWWWWWFTLFNEFFYLIIFYWLLYSTVLSSSFRWNSVSYMYVQTYLSLYLWTIFFFW